MAHKKLIDIPTDDNIFQDLQILAVKSDDDLKLYIENVLVNHVKMARANNEL